ncbi:MAG: hypothetical protein CM15mP38_2600 [Synechococcus sp.]|nr:MAG: hypothetical protein CM15mP38_2600 [Synechococcus sp.]
MGGSQGAVGLNRMVRAAVPALLEQGCRVVHLTGDNDPDIGQLQHPQLVERRFSDEMPGLLQHADLAISRAGAGSISELAVCGTPAVLVPFPQAADQHQEANAACAASLGAAVIVHQHEPDQPVLLNTVQRLLAVRLGHADSAADPLAQMREGMAALAERDAERQLAGFASRPGGLSQARGLRFNSSRNALTMRRLLRRDCNPIRSQVSPKPSKERQSRKRMRCRCSNASRKGTRDRFARISR